MFYGFVITEAGNNLLAKMVAGDKLTITKVVMDKGTAESAEAARKLTAPIDPGPNGTSTVPTVEGAAVNMLVEYRSDLNGGLQEGFWIGGFAVFGKVENGTETMIYYGSLGEQKQYVSAYVEGTAPDVRRYPVSITVTAGVEVEVSYPAEAWMTAEDVAEYFNGTLKPDLEAGLDDLIDKHNKDPNAHNGALKDKQDTIKVEGLLKGTKTTTEEGEKYSVGAATPGTDYQQPTNKLTAAEEMSTQDFIPFYDHASGQHMRATLQSLKEAIGVQSPTIKVTTCTGATVTCSDGETTLEGTGSTEFELPNVGNWTVTATLNEQTATQVVEVNGTLLYEVDLMITEGIAVTTQPNKKSYYIGEAFDPAGMVVTATFADDTTENVTDDCTFSPATISKDTTAITVSYQRGGIKKTASVAVTVRVLASIEISNPPTKTAYKYGEVFSPAGMAVTARYTDGQSRAATGYTYSPTGALKLSDTTITVSYTEGDVTKTTTQAIKVTTVNTTLDSNSWATIKAVSDAGKGDNYWDVGDTRNIVINGNVGESVYKNITIAAFIIGFNHNSIIEGNNKIHFQIGKISNKLIGLCDGRYGSSVSGSGYFSMNTYRTNAGGWNDSYMRKTLLGNSGTPSSPPSNSLLAAISADLRAVMKDVRKFTDNTGGGADHVSYVTGTTDYLFLLAEFEYHGSRTYANSAEKNYQKQYDYYKAGNSKVHNRFENPESAVYAWARSAYAGHDDSFCLVNADGTPSNYYADYSRALAPGFAV